MIKLFSVAILASALVFTGCKPKDADIKASVEEKLKANAATAATSVSVEKGIVTLGGELANPDAKAESEKIAAAIKNVKSVVNNISVAPPPPPPPPPPVIVADDPLTKAVTDATKDFPGVQATVSDGIILLKGELSRASLPKLMKLLNGLNPRKIDNQLTLK